MDEKDALSLRKWANGHALWVQLQESPDTFVTAKGIVSGIGETLQLAIKFGSFAKGILTIPLREAQAQYTDCAKLDEDLLPEMDRFDGWVDITYSHWDGHKCRLSRFKT